MPLLLTIIIIGLVFGLLKVFDYLFYRFNPRLRYIKSVLEAGCAYKILETQNLDKSKFFIITLGQNSEQAMAILDEYLDQASIQGTYKPQTDIGYVLREKRTLTHLGGN